MLVVTSKKEVYSSEGISTCECRDRILRKRVLKVERIEYKEDRKKLIVSAWETKGRYWIGVVLSGE